MENYEILENKLRKQKRNWISVVCLVFVTLVAIHLLLFSGSNKIGESSAERVEIFKIL